MPKLDKDTIWLLRGTQRKEVFTNLPENEFMPNKLRKKISSTLSLREMSRHLKDFENKGIIKCLNSEDPYNKIYLITGKGKEFQKKVNKIELK